MRGTPTYIEIDTPALGGKTWLLQEKGLFILERGQGSFGTFACTHAGSGGITAYDGIPDENGFFPEFEGEEGSKEWWMRPGREIYRAMPVVMGSWWINGGFFHGLTIWCHGGRDTEPPIGTLVWSAARKAK